MSASIIKFPAPKPSVSDQDIDRLESAAGWLAKSACTFYENLGHEGRNSLPDDEFRRVMAAIWSARDVINAFTARLRREAENPASPPGPAA